MSNKKEPPFFNEDNLGSFNFKLPFYETMELFIETLTGTCFELRVSPFETIVCVKAKIQRLEGIPIAQQHLIWNNKELEDEFSLNDYNISEGCTLKLVLAMRGGPINTRRVPLDDSVREMAEYMDPVRDDMWEKTPTNKQVTFLVYREGDQLNFFRVVDRGDGTLTPLSESLSGGSVYNMYAEDEDDIEASPSGQQIIENSITMNKMKLLKSKMENMNLNKKPKKPSKLKPRPPNAPRPTSGSMASARHRLLRVLPHIGQSCLPPGSPYVSESSHNALSTLTAATRTIPSITSDFLKEEAWESSALIPSLTSINLPPKVSRVELENASHSTNAVPFPVTCLPKKDLLIKDGDSISHQNLNIFASEDTSRSISESFALLAEAGPSESYGELCSLRKTKADFEVVEGNKEASMETHQAALSKSLNSDLMETSLFNTAELSPPRSKFLSPIHFSPQLNDATFSKTRQPKCFDFGSLSSPASQSHFQSLQLRNMADPTFSRTTRFRGVKVESPGKRSDVISKMEARDMTELVNKASKEPMGSLNNLGFFASLARSAGRDHFSSSSNPARLRNLVVPPTALQEDNSLHESLTFLSTPHGLGQSVINTSCGKKTVEATHLFPPVTSAVRSKKATKHCFLCGKKTGLATSYECRCGNNFCATHRYAETHSCTYDYKNAGRRYLQEANPVITAPKLPKI